MRKNPFEKYLSKEDLLQRKVVTYVKLQYGVTCIPLNTESKKSRFEQYKFKEMGGIKGQPDLFIPVPNSQYSGMFIELKADGVTVFKKDGSLRAGEHLQNQNNYHEMLKKHGYWAGFCIGIDQTLDEIDKYFQKK